MSKAIQRMVEGMWLLVGGVLGLLLLRALAPSFASDPLPERGADLQSQLYSSRQTAITRAVAMAEPAVVGVHVTQVQRYIERSPYRRDPFWGQFFPDRVVQKPVENLGSGFIISSEGLTLTNEHVVHNAVEVFVTLPDGREVRAEVVGMDHNSDIALLDLEGQGYPTLELGDSDSTLIGEWAIALGNPYGLFSSTRPSVTVGVVSAVDRDFGAQEDDRVYKQMLQTDAAINPGNSGGPLLNAAGQVIGMNTMIYSRNGGSVGLGFAIPSNRVRSILDDLIRVGYVNRAIWTGIWIRDLSRRVVTALGYPGDFGVVVVELNPGSPAQQAGLELHDIIVKVNSKQLADARALQQIMADEGLKVGDILHLEVFRKGRLLTLALRIGSRDDSQRGN
jgi:serine protease Do